MKIYLSVVFLLFIGCFKDAPPVNPHDVVGLYKGIHGENKDWTQEIKVKENGKYEQVVFNQGKEVYRGGGDWKVQYRAIAFEFFYCVVDVFGKTGNPSKPNNPVSGVWSDYNGRKSIVFSVNHQYYISRVGDVE